MNDPIKGDQSKPLVFSLDKHPLTKSICSSLGGTESEISTRLFPDGETYLRVHTNVAGLPCLIVVDLSNPNTKFLPLIFLADTLKEMGATNVGLIAPYLSYMRQDKRFNEGEAITSRSFAHILSQHIDWLVTIDPHLHRYHSLDEIYSVPSSVVQGAPALANWLERKEDLLLVGPDRESEQWVAEIAKLSGHSFTIGEKQRLGDRNVEITLPDLSQHQSKSAVIIDDVISSGQTILKCIKALKKQGFQKISCAAVHGIFADQSDALLLEAGIEDLVTCNTIKHRSNMIDVSPLLIQPIIDCMEQTSS